MATVYEVTLSASRAPVVSVKSDDQAAVKAGLAWARETLEALKVPVKNQPEEAKKEEVPVCAVHKVPMVKVNGKRGEFWSCHQKMGDGKWCSYRPITP